MVPPVLPKNQPGKIGFANAAGGNSRTSNTRCRSGRIRTSKFCRPGIIDAFLPEGNTGRSRGPCGASHSSTSLRVGSFENREGWGRHSWGIFETTPEEWASSPTFRKRGSKVYEKCLGFVHHTSRIRWLKGRELLWSTGSQRFRRPSDLLAGGGRFTAVHMFSLSNKAAWRAAGCGGSAVAHQLLGLFGSIDRSTTWRRYDSPTELSRSRRIVSNR